MHKTTPKQLKPSLAVKLNGNATPAIVRKYTPEETKQIIKSSAIAVDDPDKILKELGEDILPFIDNDEKTVRDKARMVLESKVKDAANVIGLETHYPILECVSNNRPLIISFARQLVKEFDCKTASEKSLVQIIASAYGRILEYSKLFNQCRTMDYVTNENIGYYSMISKELDRAHRHYISALTILRQIKTPEIKVNVKANTAFVAQNQQLNNNQQTNETNNT